MQNILVIITVLFALIYLGRQFYVRFFAKETKCEGCAVNKMMEKEKM